jgi:Zn-dependent membrane protease YugP
MSGLESRPPRSVRERRAYQLVVVSGVAGVVFVVGLLLALFNVIGMGIPLIALIVAAVCGLAFRGMVSRR